ncbi:MAG TPA: metal-dependent hydrolase [Tabrizicola sp.]|nr:metal-dependent hydrolase [Tabrizicola sp.]
MLTAHLPSGYVLARLLPKGIPYLMPAALIGSVFPDLDMIWFHLIDDRAFHHHRYSVHIPAFWLAVAAIGLPLAARLGYFRTALVFFAAILMHLILDTISGGILWGAPFSDHLFALVTVPADYSHWVISFILHWTFLSELVVWALALYLWLTRPRQAPSAA